MNENLLVFGVILLRVTAVAVGGATVWMGYRLFDKGVFADNTEIEGVWKDAKLLMKRAAPGTMFALFGATVVVASILKDISYQRHGNGGSSSFGAFQNFPPVPSLASQEELKGILDKAIRGDALTEQEKESLQDYRKNLNVIEFHAWDNFEIPGLDPGDLDLLDGQVRPKTS